MCNLQVYPEVAGGLFPIFVCRYGGKLYQTRIEAFLWLKDEGPRATFDVVSRLTWSNAVDP